MKANKFGSKVVASIEKKLDALWQSAVQKKQEEEVEDEIQLRLVKTRELSPKKVGAVIYVSRSTLAGQEYEGSLDSLEACRREYCIEENLKVLRVFREESLSSRNHLVDEMNQFCREHEDEVAVVLLHLGPEMYFEF